MKNIKLYDAYEYDAYDEEYDPCEKDHDLLLDLNYFSECGAFKVQSLHNEIEYNLNSTAYNKSEKLFGKNNTVIVNLCLSKNKFSFIADELAVEYMQDVELDDETVLYTYNNLKIIYDDTTFEMCDYYFGPFLWVDEKFLDLINKIDPKFFNKKYLRLWKLAFSYDDVYEGIEFMNDFI